MSYTGSCHCGKVSYEVDAEIDNVIECNCSICRTKGYLLWFVPRERLALTSGEQELATYTFNTHKIKHHFCQTCGVATFGFGEHPPGTPMAAVNVRCLPDVDLATLQTVPIDGRSQ